MNSKLAVGMEEAAEMCSVSPQLVRQWCSNKVIPFLRVGNKFIVKISTLDEFLRLNEDKDLKSFSTLIRPK